MRHVIFLSSQSPRYIDKGTSAKKTEVPLSASEQLNEPLPHTSSSEAGTTLSVSVGIGRSVNRGVLNRVRGLLHRLVNRLVSARLGVRRFLNMRLHGVQGVGLGVDGLSSGVDLSLQRSSLISGHLTLSLGVGELLAKVGDGLRVELVIGSGLIELGTKLVGCVDGFAGFAHLASESIKGVGKIGHCGSN